jgi:hypothetical protein
MNPIAVENNASPSRKDAKECARKGGGENTIRESLESLLPHPHTEPSAMEGCLGGVLRTRRWLQ